jgi:hypothetical protein
MTRLQTSAEHTQASVSAYHQQGLTDFPFNKSVYVGDIPGSTPYGEPARKPEDWNAA